MVNTVYECCLGRVLDQVQKRLILSTSFFRNETSHVMLQLLRNSKKVEKVIYGSEYILRAQMSHNDGELDKIVRSTETVSYLALELTLYHMSSALHDGSFARNL